MLFGRHLAAAAQRGDDDTPWRGWPRRSGQRSPNAAKLVGAYAPQRTEVDVTVSTSPQEIIAETERRLLALAAERQQQLPANVIEGEVIA